jgi:hypothetical protein
VDRKCEHEQGPTTKVGIEIPPCRRWTRCNRSTYFVAPPRTCRA